MAQPTTVPQTHTPTHDEQILVIRRGHLFPDGAWYGLEDVDMQEYLHIVKTYQEYQPRSQMEQDPRYKQIIPYLIFRYKDQYFLMERKATASEQRLKSKLTLGIGGHIRKEDLEPAEGETRGMFDWARREFNEEINYNGSFKIKPLGLLNDDSNSVGQVHIGFVFLLEGDSPNISVRSELKDGHLATLEECIALKDRMETWSALVLEALE